LSFEQAAAGIGTAERKGVRRRVHHQRGIAYPVKVVVGILFLQGAHDDAGKGRRLSGALRFPRGNVLQHVLPGVLFLLHQPIGQRNRRGGARTAPEAGQQQGPGKAIDRAALHLGEFMLC